MPVDLVGVEVHGVAGAHRLDGLARDWKSPAPSVTWIVCPNGCACQAVRAPGVKCTLSSFTCGPGEIGSMKTSPVNHSAGPRLASGSGGDG